MKKKNIYIKNLSNKQPTKDITPDDIKFKIPKITANKKISVKINNKITFNDINVPIIAGPNGVESRKLIFNVAQFLKKKGVKIFNQALKQATAGNSAVATFGVSAGKWYIEQKILGGANEAHLGFAL